MLKDKVAVITGGSRGIGYSIAELFLLNGAKVILISRFIKDNSLEKLRELGEVSLFAGDVSDYEFIQKTYQDIFKKYKRLDVLVNNAGILEDSLLGMVTPDLLKRVMDVNVNGVIYNMQLATRLMVRQNRGSIINMSSIIGRVGNEGQVVYGASKAAVIGATLSAAKEFAPKKIRVNAIAPGFINTEMTKGLPKDKYNERLSSVKMGAIGEPEDIAKLALFLASDDSLYITGQVIGVDGGMLI